MLEKEKIAQIISFRKPLKVEESSESSHVISHYEAVEWLKDNIDLGIFLEGIKSHEDKIKSLLVLDDFLKTLEKDEDTELHGLEPNRIRAARILNWIKMSLENIDFFEHEGASSLSTLQETGEKRKKLADHAKETYFFAHRFVTQKGDIEVSEVFSLLRDGFEEGGKRARETDSDFLEFLAKELKIMAVEIKDFIERLEVFILKEKSRGNVVKITNDSGRDDLDSAVFLKIVSLESKKEKRSDLQITKGVLEKVERDGIKKTEQLLEKLLAGLREKNLQN